MKTRMERYKELRERLSSEVDQNIASHDLSTYANRLNKIDDEHFQDMNEGLSADYEPSRAKDVDLKKYETFENEYLKDFLDEVKSYNIEKGIRHVDDTEQNILEEIQSKSKENLAFDTGESPLRYDDLDFLDLEQNDNSKASIDFDKALEEIVSLKNNSNDKVNFFDGEAPDVNNMEIETLQEESVDADALIASLESNNFTSEDENVDKKSELEKEELKSVENFDPFWEEYQQKMNELDSQEDDISDDNSNLLDSPKKHDDTTNEIENKERDITQEFLALTREIEKENLESIDSTDESFGDVNVDVEAHVSTSKEEEKTFEEDSSTSLEVDEDSYKNRFVNAILTVALAGIILGVAIAIKYFFLSN